MLPCRSSCLYIATSLVLFHIAELKAATNPGNSTYRQYYLIFDHISSIITQQTTIITNSGHHRIIINYVQ